MTQLTLGYTDAVEQAMRSPKFLAWDPVLILLDPEVSQFGRPEVAERHYTPVELAEAWGLSPDLIRELFENEDGVLIVSRNQTRYKRQYRTFRIPESVAARVHRRLSERRGQNG